MAVESLYIDVACSLTFKLLPGANLDKVYSDQIPCANSQN